MAPAASRFTFAAPNKTAGSVWIARFQNLLPHQRARAFDLRVDQPHPVARLIYLADDFQIKGGYDYDAYSRTINVYDNSTAFNTAWNAAIPAANVGQTSSIEKSNARVIPWYTRSRAETP